jgi:hypothetical protein
MSKMCCSSNFFSVKTKLLLFIFQLYHTASPSDAYGFEQSAKEYTLGEFGVMADEFKRNYFNKSLSVCFDFQEKKTKYIYLGNII